MADAPAPFVEPVPAPPAGKSLLTAGGIIIAIAALYFGRDIFIPFAVAILLSFALAPLVSLLRRLKLPKIVAILVAVALAFSVIGAISVVVGSQVVQLADNLPRYQHTITQKIRSSGLPAPEEASSRKLPPPSRTSARSSGVQKHLQARGISNRPTGRQGESLFR